MYSGRFEKAIDKLVNAFLNEDLMPGDCYKCAVGNLVGSNLWGHLFTTHDGVQEFHIPIRDKSKWGMRERTAELKIKATGYSLLEVAEIEKAFERATKIKAECYPEAGFDDHPRVAPRQARIEDQHNGLMAVVDVLLSFEPETKPESESAVRERFNHPVLSN